MAAKIKDGLFIGDAETSQSEVFINDNKISNLVNLSGKEVPNIWASHGLVYLTYNWEDRPDYKLFSGHEDNILTDLVEFVDVSIAHGISVLFFSKNGTGRCVVAACLYLMMKYRWGFEKSYDYVYSKKPDIDLNKGFIQQMFALDMKLLATRQKAFALKHGIENTFKIEPNMTINDIAAMLPPLEAKRWNSWEPTYLLNPNNISAEKVNEEDITWQKYSDSIYSVLKKKDKVAFKASTNQQKAIVRVLDDNEEELVLVFSFLNGKNTISSLPGPYLNAYSQPKSFKLRFDNIHFEEDINMFPTSPSRSSSLSVKSILKGSKKLIQETPAPRISENQAKAVEEKSPKDQNNTLLIHNSQGIRNSIELTTLAMAAKNNSNNYNTKSNSTSDDLYRFVGMPAQSKDEGYNNIGRDDKKNVSHMDNYSNKANPPVSNGNWFPDDDKKPLSAEERLRKLMADIQKQNNLPDSSTNSYSGSNMPNSANRPTSAPVSRSGAKADTPDNSRNAPSLYDLANMNLYSDAKQPGSSRSRPNQDPQLYSSSYGSISNSKPSNNDITVEDFEQESNHNKSSDPLAAFDVGYQNSTSKGALRARHDALNGSAAYPKSSVPTTNTTSRPTPKPAWGSSSTTNNPRYSSPNNRNTSNSSIGSEVDNSFVGAGSTTSSRVYRHGSPAPNNRPNTTKAPSSPRNSSNISVTSNSSISTLGTSLSGVQQNNSISVTGRTTGYSSPQTKSNTMPSRYASPMADRSSNLPSQTTQRRTSFGSVGSNISASDPKKRSSTGGSSPLRASYGSNSSQNSVSSNTSARPSSASAANSASGVSSRRFSTPTPQSGQHNEYDSNSKALRSSTPSKTWKF